MLIAMDNANDNTAPYTPDCYWHVSDADYLPLPWEKEMKKPAIQDCRKFTPPNPERKIGERIVKGLEPPFYKSMQHQLHHERLAMKDEISLLKEEVSRLRVAIMISQDSGEPIPPSFCLEGEQ